MLNFIVSMKKRRFITLQREDAIKIIQDISVTKDFVLETLQEKLSVFKLAEVFSLTAYDAAYLDLAQRLRVPLLTYDAALLNAALTAGVKTNISSI
jgi:predicted nucleic acid-binding protein